MKRIYRIKSAFDNKYIIALECYTIVEEAIKTYTSRVARHKIYIQKKIRTS